MNWVSSIKQLGIILATVMSLHAHAHETGFGHSRRTLYVGSSRGGYLLDYRIHMNRENAIAEIAHMDANRDGKVSNAEREAWLAEKAIRLQKKLEVHDGHSAKAATMKLVDVQLDHGLTQTFRYQITTTAPAIQISDRVFDYRPGLLNVRHSADLDVNVPDAMAAMHAGKVKIDVQKRPISIVE